MATCRSRNLHHDYCCASSPSMFPLKVGLESTSIFKVCGTAMIWTHGKLEAESHPPNKGLADHLSSEIHGVLFAQISHKNFARLAFCSSVHPDVQSVEGLQQEDEASVNTPDRLCVLLYQFLIRLQQIQLGVCRRTYVEDLQSVSKGHLCQFYDWFPELGVLHHPALYACCQWF